jgi:predicted component of viral defense system (DUF524 family)
VGTSDTMYDALERSYESKQMKQLYHYYILSHFTTTLKKTLKSTAKADIIRHTIIDNI